MRQKGYLSQYWFIVRMIRQESAMFQYGTGTNYQKTKLTGDSNVSGEPLYGPPRGFGLKQLDNWGSSANPQYATSQHLWNWKENIEGGVEVIREKKAAVDKAKANNDELIKKWNEDNPSDPVSDSLEIKSGTNAGSKVLTITEGNVTFAVNPTGAQKNIYDALWIQLFNGGTPYYKLVQCKNEKGNLQKPGREIYRNNTNNGSYVNKVCSRSD